MSRRRHRHTAFAAPLVVIACVPSCSKDPQPEPKARPPRVTVDAAVAAAPIDAPPAVTPDADPADLKITFNGHICLQGPPGKESSVPCPDELLPEAPAGEPVIAFYKECRTKGYQQVRCPPGGPNIVAPKPDSKKSGDTTTSFDDNAMACTEYRDMHCPEGASCNPPPPRPVPCPDDLLPSLAPGIAPTSRKGGECFFGALEVVCPTEEMTGPAVQEIKESEHAKIVLRAPGDCWREYKTECDPGVKCNPPEPVKVDCPDALLPAVVNGKQPTKHKDGTCTWGNTQVRCQ